MKKDIPNKEWEKEFDEEVGTKSKGIITFEDTKRFIRHQKELSYKEGYEEALEDIKPYP